MPWFGEQRSKLLDQRRQAKLQWLQDPSEVNGDNPNNVRPVVKWIAVPGLMNSLKIAYTYRQMFAEYLTMDLKSLNNI
jgi:hypothetical protein